MHWKNIFFENLSTFTFIFTLAFHSKKMTKNNLKEKKTSVWRILSHFLCNKIPFTIFLKFFTLQLLGLKCKHFKFQNFPAISPSNQSLLFSKCRIKSVPYINVQLSYRFILLKRLIFKSLYNSPTRPVVRKLQHLIIFLFFYKRNFSFD